MPPLTNPFPSSKLSDVWTTLVQALKTDPVLRSAVRGWCAFDGSDEDLAEPSEEDCPYLRLEPVQGSGAWYDENSHMITLPIKLTLGVVGADCTFLFDFWDATRAALFTGNTVINALLPFGCVSKTLTVPAVGATTWGEATGLAGVGTLLLKIRLDS